MVDPGPDGALVHEARLRCRRRHEHKRMVASIPCAGWLPATTTALTILPRPEFLQVALLSKPETVSPVAAAFRRHPRSLQRVVRPAMSVHPAQRSCRARLHAQLSGPPPR